MPGAESAHRALFFPGDALCEVRAGGPRSDRDYPSFAANLGRRSLGAATDPQSSFGGTKAKPMRSRRCASWMVRLSP